MIVMGIIAILMPLGINAFISTRRSREAAEAAANARDAIKNARSMALSVASPVSGNGWPVAYEVVFSGSTVVTNVKFLDPVNIPFSNWNPSATFLPNYVEETLDLGTVGVTSVSTATSSACDRVVFSSVSGEMFVYNGSYASEISGNCEIEFTSGNKSLFLVLNSTEKRFDIVGSASASVSEPASETPGGGDIDIYMPVE